MKAGEVIRIIVFSFLGFILMFFIQPWIYRSGIIRISDDNVPVEDWLQDYTTGASIVFASSIIATVVWYVMAAKAKVPSASDTDKWRVVWWLFLLLPILSICLGISVFNRSKDALVLVSLTGFYILDAFLLYWLPTATSSPGSLMFIPPGAFLLRRLIGA